MQNIRSEHVVNGQSYTMQCVRSSLYGGASYIAHAKMADKSSEYFESHDQSHAIRQAHDWAKAQATPSKPAKRSQWRKGSAARLLRDGTRDEVQGYVFAGVFCAYRYAPKMKFWDVTHIASGLAMSTNLPLYTLRRAKEYAERCYALLPPAQWELAEPGIGTPEVQDAAYRLRCEFREAR